MKNFKKIGLLLLAAILLVACGNKNENEIKLIYVNWAEGIAMTNVAKILLEENGYEVNMKNADVAPIFASLSRGNADVFMDVWLPTTHEDYMKQYSASLEVLGNNFDDARIGLVVPAYVDINSIEELNDHKDKFKSEIVGIDAGAGLMKAADKSLSEYGIDFKLLTASEAAMTASLKKAINNNSWVVVTGWTPHWMFSRFDLKMLEDPKGVFGDAEQIKTIARKGFSEEQPYVAEFFTNVSFTTEQIGSLMQTIEDAGNEVAGAQKWINENRELTNSWLPATN
mgnify:FL=1